MNKSLLEVPVVILFYIRPDTLKKVFEMVKQARPSILFLIQDGPENDNVKDLELIKECRLIVENIDWDCAVYKNYSELNLGCGVRPYSGISWVFKHVERAIILEDDCVPALSFFKFCDEMLERYKDDQRVGIISGLNHFDEYYFGGCSYGFAKSAGIWGWATWKDRWAKYTEEDFLLPKITNDYVKKCLLMDISPKFAAKHRVSSWSKQNVKLNKNNYVPSYWDSQWSLVRYLNSWVSIVPKYNQITNIGIGNGATHSVNHIKYLPKKISRFFFKETRELSFPLIHPDYLLADRNYDKRYYKIIHPNFLIRISQRLHRCVIKFIYINNKVR